MKNLAIERLKELAWAETRRRYPNVPYPVIRQYSDRTANGLTRCIIDFIRFSGGHAERINNTGRPVDHRRIVTDVMGYRRVIGSMKWIPGTGTRGTADISAIYLGKSVKIEVKIDRDRQSASQKEYQQSIGASGGIYLIARSFNEFYQDWQGLFG